jgi:hypothetical protein
MSFNSKLEALLNEYEVGTCLVNNNVVMYSEKSQSLVIMRDIGASVDVMMFDNVTVEESQDALDRIAGQ